MARKAPQTIAAGNGIAADAAFRSVTPPIYLSSTYAFDGYDGEGAYAYGRQGNPTRDLLADTLAKLEGGAGAVITSSGMAAVDLVLSRLAPGELVVAPHDCYWGTYRLLAERAGRGQFRAAFVDQSDPAAVAEALGDGAALLLIETPSNPLMRVVDVRALTAAARGAGAKVAVDNTFLSPALQQPIALGADYVIHSTTKYLNGHSDVVGGAVVAADASEVRALTAWTNVVGTIGSPFDAYLSLRGLRTLFPRVERQQANAAAVAQFLDAHPAVSVVHYPGLATHPSHAIAASQQGGFGAMLSFELAGGPSRVKPLVEALRVITLAESLGGVESLIAHPATMTHLGMGPEGRAAAGISDALLRLSVGLEAEAALIADIAQALEAA